MINQYQNQYQYPNYNSQPLNNAFSNYNMYAKYDQKLPIQNGNIQSSNVNWIQVNGYQGAKDIIVQPNQTSWLMNTNAQEFYVKSADNMGVSSLKCYSFKEIDPNSIENSLDNKNVVYVTKSEFDSLKEKIQALEKNIETKNKTKKGDD